MIRIAVERKNNASNAGGDVKSFTLVSCIIAVCLFVWVVESPVNTIQEREIIGRWYMHPGTTSYKLEFQRNHILLIESHGCFSNMTEVAKWQQKGEKIEIKYSRYEGGLGPVLYVKRVFNNIVLVPEDKLDFVSKFGYLSNFCFWRNLAEEGVRLSPDAHTVHKAFIREYELKCPSK